MTTQAMGPSFVRVRLQDLVAPRLIDLDLTVFEAVESVYGARIDFTVFCTYHPQAKVGWLRGVSSHLSTASRFSGNNNEAR